MPQPVSPGPHPCLGAVLWAAGIAVAGIVGMPAAPARAAQGPGSGQPCERFDQRCEERLASPFNHWRTLDPALTNQRHNAGVGRQQRQGLDFGQPDAQLAQTFGRPSPGPYGSPYPSRPNYPYQNPGGLPAPGPMPGQVVSPPLTPPANLSFPAAGVICDSVYKLCYNNQGVSQSLSTSTFGQVGFASAMLAIQRGLQKQFLLSNGTFCDTSVPACWSDGMARRIPAPMMNSQLFYSANPGGGMYPGGMGPATNNFATCRLQQGFQVLYNGRCQLSRQAEGNRMRFNVQMGNGSLFSFVNRGDSYRIRDNNGGIWPVNHIDQGATGIFTWANYSLMMAQDGYSGSARPSRSLGGLLESLFR
jgi:hypothetical protein